MWLVILVILILLLGGGWGYGRWGGPEPAGYSGPVGLLFLILVVVLVIWLIRGVGP